MSKDLSLFSMDKKVPSFLTEAGTDGGNEGMSADDIAVPQLKILQPLSPELMMNIEGAKPGMFINSVTHEVYDELFLINLMYEHNFAIFKTREAGGGKQGQANSRKEAMDIIATMPGSAADYQIVDTGIHKLLALDEAGNPTSPMQIYMSSTKKTISMRWNTQIQLKCEELGIPRYGSVWLMTATNESNHKGSWYGFKVEFAGVVTDEALFSRAREIRTSLEGQSEWIPPQQLTAPEAG